MPSSAMIVPPCPSGVVFHKEDFLHDGFSIDGFLARYASNYGLEPLRDDLGMYLQVLRVAMIELINDDYADFVNLSSNLVGIDDKILSIETPMIEFKDQIEAFQSKLDSTRGQLEAKLAQRKALHDQRVALRNLEHIITLLNKVERLLGLHEGSEKQLELTGDLVERVASDVNYLNHCVSKCEASAFVEEIQPRINVIGDRLHKAMEAHLLTAINDKDAEVLKRCLRIYASVERVSDAEALLRTKIIGPFLEDVITSQKLHSDPLGLAGICQNILRIMPEKLDLILTLSLKKKSQDFHFVLNSLWPEVAEKFEQRLAIIFSAGNPDQFHKNYITVTDFIKKLEARAENPCQFRSSKAVQNFIHKWNLPVYFQIRFQEIGGPVEEACQELFNPSEDDGTNFRLMASDVAMKAMADCWSSTVFLRPLTQKFWKLNLQIIARYSKAVSLSVTPEHLESLCQQPQSEALQIPSKGHSRTSSSGAKIDVPQMIDGRKSPSIKTEQKGMKGEEMNNKIISLYMDILKISSTELNNVLENLVWPALMKFSPEDSNLSDTAKDYFYESLQESQKELQEKLTLITNVITDRIASKSVAFLKQVSDIPRLFRRTNRELPSKPCSYMTSLLEPILDFSKCQDVQKIWLETIFAKVTVKLLTNVSEVLDAVQKMEESLLRLRRVRDKSSSTSLASKDDKSSKGVSDDDKIRLQLFVDVNHYLKSMKSLDVEPDDPAKKLEELVTKATNACLLPDDAKTEDNEQ